MSSVALSETAVRRKQFGGVPRRTDDEVRAVLEMKSSTDPATGCREWNGKRQQPYEYGVTRFRGKGWRTHRVAWTLANGEIPEGMFVCHRCDNPPCINVEHLWLGTNEENMADMARKGRVRAKTHPETIERGEAHWTRRTPWLMPSGARHWAVRDPSRITKGSAIGTSLLTEELVSEMRRRFSGGERRSSLAASFGISYYTVWDITTRRSWKHVA